MNDEEKLCGICYNRIEYDGPILLRAGCVHEFHAACLTRWIKPLKKKNECPCCRRLIEDLNIYKKNGEGMFEWTKEPDNKVKIKLPMPVSHQTSNASCPVCYAKWKGDEEEVTQCKNCWNLIHSACAEQTATGSHEYICVRCRKIDFNMEICFVCYSDTAIGRKTQCSGCKVWCHQNCYNNKMIMEDGCWICNWCVLSAIHKKDNYFDHIRNELGNRETKWLKLRTDPVFPEQFIRPARRILNTSPPLTQLEKSEKLLTALVKVFTPNTRPLRNRIAGFPLIEIEVSPERKELQFDMLHLSNEGIDKIHIEVIIT